MNFFPAVLRSNRTKSLERTRGYHFSYSQTRALSTVPFFEVAVVAVLLAFGAGPLPASDPAPIEPSTFTVVIDPGHDAASPGAVSARGKLEWVFNDMIARALTEQLQRKRDVRTVLSRSPGERLSSTARLNRIRGADPDLVVSLHHDSAQVQFFSTWTFEGKRLRFCDQFSGFSILVPGQGFHHALSLLVAQQISDRLLANGFRFSSHHAMKIPGEARNWLDEKRGIYNGDYVWLLKNVGCPAVLVELGVIVNRDQEQQLADPAVVERLAMLLAEAIDETRPQFERQRCSEEPPGHRVDDEAVPNGTSRRDRR